MSYHNEYIRVAQDIGQFLDIWGLVTLFSAALAITAYRAVLELAAGPGGEA